MEVRVWVNGRESSPHLVLLHRLVVVRLQLDERPKDVLVLVRVVIAAAAGAARSGVRLRNPRRQASERPMNGRSTAAFRAERVSDGQGAAAGGGSGMRAAFQGCAPVLPWAPHRSATGHGSSSCPGWLSSSTAAC